MDNWTQTMGAGALLSIAAGAILLILLLIIKFRIHALLALIINRLETE